MKTIWNMISRSGHHVSARVFPEVEDDEILFSKNNVCVHPCAASSAVPRHSLGYLTVTAAPDPALGHTLLLCWRPNQLMVGAGRRGPRTLSETRPAAGCVTAGHGCVTARHGSQYLAAGDAVSLYPDGTHSAGDVTPSSCDVTPSSCDVTPSSCDVTRSDYDVRSSSCNGVAAGSGTEATACAASRSAPRLELHPGPAGPPEELPPGPAGPPEELPPGPAGPPEELPPGPAGPPEELPPGPAGPPEELPPGPAGPPEELPPGPAGPDEVPPVRQDQDVRHLELPRDQDRELRRRLSTQSAPPSPSPRPRHPASDAPALFTVDLGQARFVRVFLTPDDPGCGQLVLCSRQSQYRILHFHCGGLDRLVRVFDGWRHLQPAGGDADNGGCRLFSVCSPVVVEGDDHPEEGHYGCLTADVWHQMLTPDGRVTDPGQLREVVFFGGLEPRLRPPVWPLLLGVLSCSDSAEERHAERRRLELEFERICALPDELPEVERDEFQRLVVSTVDKDVVRTDPTNPFFCGRSNPNVQTLRRILLGFAAANPSLGYTQGMSDLLAPLLVTLGAPADAYWALDALIKRSASVICPRDDAMDVQLGYLRELLRLLTPDFYRHLSSVEDGLELLFTHRWLLLCFKREFTEPAALQIWEACWSCQQTRHFCLFVSAAICAAYAADVTDSAMNADAILLHFTSLSQHMDSEVVLRKARGLLHRFLSLDAVPCSLASLCGGGDGGGARAWHSRRVAPIVCRGHSDGDACPARPAR